MKLSNTIADLLSATLYNGLHCDSLDRNLIEVLLCHECDYYEIIELLSTIMPEKCHLEDVELLQSLAPTGKSLDNLGPTSIRGMIPRWTATKYHTAPIARVVWDIQQKCHARQPGIFTYHSNLNPRNKRSADDPYVLLVSKDRWIFLDINRKWTYTYLYNEGEGQC